VSEEAVLEGGVPVTDYYPILMRAVAALDTNTVQTRAVLFARARSMLFDQVRDDRTRWTEAAIKEEFRRFDFVVNRIEVEFAGSSAEGSLNQDLTRQRRQLSRQFQEPSPHAARVPPATTNFGRTGILTAAGISSLLLSGILAFTYGGWNSSRTPQARGVEKTFATAPATRPSAGLAVDTYELAPGVDGGSSGAGLPYYFRRQLVYYRSVYSDGMSIVDRSQRFLYLVQPQSRAWRYGIGVGGECSVSTGFYRIARKTEWPEWSPSPELAKLRSYPARLAGGPGNPMGARAIYFENGAVGIHGTNAPKSIGHALSLGCLRLANDDIVDLDTRVSIGAGVVVLN